MQMLLLFSDILPKIRRKAKRVHKIKFQDGQIFTILDVEPNPQTGNVTLYLRRHVGLEFLLIPLLLGAGLFFGNMAYGATGALMGAMGSGIGGVAIISQTTIGSRMIKRTLPASSIIGFDNYFQLKSKKYVFCCHTFDSLGNPVMPGSDPIAVMSKRMEELEWTIKFMRDEVATLRFNLSQSQKTGKELTDEVASTLKKIIESTVTPSRAREARVPYRYPTEYYPTEMMPPKEEGE